MTQLSARAVAAFIERECQQRNTIDLGDVFRWLRDVLEIPDHRARAGISRALDRGRIT